MFFKNKQKVLEKQLFSYGEKAALCIQEFQRTFQAYAETHDFKALQEDVEWVHKAESEADDIRREVEDMMYTRALFPESRGDILGLLEALDSVPNQAEKVVRAIVNQRIVLPDDLCPSLLELVDVSCRAASAMLEAASKLFGDFTSATAITGRIDELESLADAQEAALTQLVFAGSYDPLSKILLRDLIKHIAAISDRAENVGDRIRIIVVKRMV